MRDAVFFDPQDIRAGAVARAFDAAVGNVPPYHRRRIREAQRAWHADCVSGVSSADEVVQRAVRAAQAHGVQRPLVQGFAQVGLPLVGAMGSESPGSIDLLMHAVSESADTGRTLVNAGRDVAVTYFDSEAPTQLQTWMKEVGDTTRTVVQEGNTTARTGLEAGAKTVQEIAPEIPDATPAIIGLGLIAAFAWMNS